MFGFGKRKAKVSEERANALLGHLVQVAANAYLGEKTDADMERLADHLAADLEGADADTVRAALGNAVIIQGAQIAKEVLREEDVDPLDYSEALNEAEEAGKVWAEDRT